MVVLFLFPRELPALDVWRHPEAAEKNALFLNINAASLSFHNGFYAGLSTLQAGIDYVLPLFLPLSIGGYFNAPNPNLKRFGTRIAYHIDLGDRSTDLYVLYVFDFGFLRNPRLEAYGDEKQPVHFYDFRAGVRRLFGNYFCLTLETDFKLSGLTIGISIKFF